MKNKEFKAFTKAERNYKRGCNVMAFGGVVLLCTIVITAFFNSPTIFYIGGITTAVMMFVATLLMRKWNNIVHKY